MICEWTEQIICITHYRRLNFFVGMVMKFEMINKSIKFEQMKWLKPDYELKTELRIEAENKFQELFCISLSSNLSGMFGKDVKRKKEW